MKELFVCRHGETDFNRQEVLHGHIDAEMTEKGRMQAKKLGKKLDKEEIEKIYSSDLSRARETAEIVSEETGAEIREKEKLRGRDFGRFEGKKRDSRRNEIDSAEQLDSWRPKGGENLKDMQERVSKVLNEIKNRNISKCAIIGHTWTNRAIIIYLTEIKKHAHRLSQSNTGLTHLKKHGFRGWKLKKMNTTCHLQPMNEGTS